MGPHPAVAAIRLAVRRVLHDVLTDHSPARPARAPRWCSSLHGGADSMALASALAFEAPELGVRAGGVTVDHGLQDGSDRARRRGRRRGCAALRPRPGRGRRRAPSAAQGGPGGRRPRRPLRRPGRRRRAPRRRRRPARPHPRRPGGDRAARARPRLRHPLAVRHGRRLRARRPLPPPVPRRWTAQTARKACLVQAHRRSGTTRTTPTPPTPAPGSATRRLPVLEKALGKGVVEALARTAQLSRDDADALDAWAADADGHGRVDDDRHACDVRRGCTRLPPAVRRRVLRRAAIAAGSPAGSLFARHIEEVDRLITDWRGQGAINLPGRRRGRDGRVADWSSGRLTAAADRTTSPTPRHRTAARVARVNEKDMGTDLESVLITKEEIDAKLAELAAKIDADYAGKDLLIVGVLKGAVMVMADLARALSTAGHDGLDGGVLLRRGHQVLRRGPHPQGPRHRHQGPARPDRRGHHRLRADAVLAAVATSARASPPRWRSAPCCASRTRPRSRST